MDLMNQKLNIVKNKMKNKIDILFIYLNFISFIKRISNLLNKNYIFDDLKCPNC